MLHSLVIKNFRCLEDFTVEKLGRVNLIVGKNNSGKSTVLEALRIYAGNANVTLLEEISNSHDEDFIFVNKENKNNKVEFFDMNLIFSNFFYKRELPKHDLAEIIISDTSKDKNQRIVILREFVLKNRVTKEETRTKSLNKNIENDLDNYIINQEMVVIKNGITFNFDSFILEKLKEINCNLIPTQFISVDELAVDWDNIVYTEHEKIVIDALKIIIPEFEHLVFVQNERQTSNRIAKVKLSNHPRPVPLKSLGDGMTRILQLALKLVSAQGGFLLIDEFENGLHYSTQEKIWSWLFEVAEQLDIQVFATTHSWDCIESFATVANEKENIEAVLFRMGRSAKKSNQGQIIATVFDKEKLFNVTQADIEIR